jgi:hypothetical protein
MGIKVYSGDGGGQTPPGYYKAPALSIVDVNCDESLSKWADILHLERRELLEAVREFGPVVRDIRRGLLRRSEEAA